MFFKWLWLNLFRVSFHYYASVLGRKSIERYIWVWQSRLWLAKPWMICPQEDVSWLNKSGCHWRLLGHVVINPRNIKTNTTRVTQSISFFVNSPMRCHLLHGLFWVVACSAHAKPARTVWYQVSVYPWPTVEGFIRFLQGWVPHFPLIGRIWFTNIPYGILKLVRAPSRTTASVVIMSIAATFMPKRTRRRKRHATRLPRTSTNARM